ncbi:MAG: glycerate kinase [Synergistaceae bacterium]|jgi:hydroxypyruvate reductase|nr:glycerate kinase [Synergistaceae bacterium]
MTIRETAISVAKSAIESVLPERAVKEALADPMGGMLGGMLERTAGDEGIIVLVAIGKAAWRMANAAHELLGPKIARGCVITKDGHSMGPIGSLEIFEAAHPVLEQRNLDATRRTLEMLKGLTEKDTVLFLVSGGGSALFELPLDGVTLKDLADMTGQLLACGADIVEINTLRKRVSSVKGGRFAQACAPARVLSVVLSDVLGDRLDSIASGPAYPDSSTCADADRIMRKYGLIKLPAGILEKFSAETPKKVDNVITRITGSVPVLCESARKSLVEKGFATTLLTTTLDCEASAAGAFFAALAREAARTRQTRSAPVAYVAGGETVVKLRGKGKGGRCQEMALAAALGLRGLEGVAFVAAGSDGTDGPTDAAGGVVDGETAQKILDQGLDPRVMLDDNDAYHALKASGDLLITGPTGTNVNDLIVTLIE